MIGDMPRPRPPRLQCERNRHGKTVWYVRLDRRSKRIRIHGEFGSQEFENAYQAALSGRIQSPPRKPGHGSLAWLVAQYRDSSAWVNGLSAATRRQRENIFKGALTTAGSDVAARVTSKHIRAGLERRKHTPSQAKNFLEAMRGLFEWAVEAEHVPADPTFGIKAPPRPKTKGFPKWTVEDEARYEARWPLGTRQRVWLDVLRYTGLRRGDAVLIGRPHVRNGTIILRTEKSGEEIIIAIPILPPLAASLAAGPIGDLTFICGANGGPLTKESFGNEFGAAARMAGIKKSAHGVRKLSATTAAENSATDAELDSLFGWKRGSGTSKVYTAEADRVRLGKASAAKMLRTPDEHSIPAPSRAIPAPAKISRNSKRLGVAK